MVIPGFPFPRQPIFNPFCKIVDLPLYQVLLPAILPFLPTMTLFPVIPLFPKVLPDSPVIPVRPAFRSLSAPLAVPKYFPLLPIHLVLRIYPAVAF